MKKTILITGSTDGIGLATAKTLLTLGHTVLIHGRSAAKLANTKQQLLAIADGDRVFSYQADLSVLDAVKTLANEIKNEHSKLDVIINNAGVFVVPETVSADGLDTRFVVNTIAPYILTKALLPLLDNNGRVVNLSSAAQASVNPEELTQPSALSDNNVYAKSKLALTMWSRQLSLTLGNEGPVIVAVNPKSFLGSKMVEKAYGVAGSNLQIGADILVKAALSEEFANATGLYFDNDSGRFASPHPDALNSEKISQITSVLNTFAG
ncbi:SDR family NAD(P)-dependent oxidoreductase [Paraglaciecola aquimarina]|uniref:SDR family NAD(P)-dependent oxidoreductase n=1 Tax=Paraglaciecola aquimarina TaxID=1235557 RepID=A0ABU3SU44_9ALTE|nr:SDR family NAD(P)-dependent oxidoreductase [Paraglaciecola aquimarina]MDU0353535.1 SDR family NAD(P)-dependent oxidoreductase [Paraglaciecola aquimarina]